MPVQYVLGICPADMKGAPQVLRGPTYALYEGQWVWCFWRLEGPPPGGWCTRVCLCTERTLPRWARRVVRRRPKALRIRLASDIYYDTRLASQTTSDPRVYLCSACHLDHPATRAGRPWELEGGPMDDTEDCDACGNEVGPYRGPGRIDYGEDDLQRWAEGRQGLRQEELRAIVRDLSGRQR